MRGKEHTFKSALHKLMNKYPSTLQVCAKNFLIHSVVRAIFDYTPSLSILKPKTTDHVDAERPERVSGIATPLPNGMIQTSAATIAVANVKNPNFVLDVRKKATPIKTVDTGRSAKKATEA